MKNKRKSTRTLAILLTIIITLGLLPKTALAGSTPEIIWPSFRGNAQNMAVVDAETARTAKEAELKWALQIVPTNFMGPFPNTPVIVGEHLIVSQGANIYKVNKNTGQVVTSEPMVSAAAFNISSITYGDGMVFAPVSNGRIQAFDAETLVSLWVSEPMGGQSNSYITYHDGYVYTGFWTGSSGNNYYVCLDVTDEDPSQTTELKEVLWKHETKAGYYWVNGIVMGDYILFGSENGSAQGAMVNNDPSKIFALDRLTGELSDTLEGLVGDQRSGISYDEDTGRLFFTTRSGYVCSVKFDATTGKFVDNTFVSKLVVSGWQATGTPVVYDGVLFIGVGGGVGGGGRLIAADAETLDEIDQVALLAYSQSSPLLSTAYYRDTGKLYIYTTYNNNPGGLTVVEYDSATKKLAKEELFTPPAAMQQYTLDSAICDTDGTIYYRNDSGYIFAIARTGDPGSGAGTPVSGNITVSFSLYGAVRHDGSGAVQTLAAGNLVQWLAPRDVTVPAGSTVGDVFARVLNSNDYSFIGLAGNYISSITHPTSGVTLREMTNGPNSGWMYTVNGSHPLLGLNDCVVNDGDVIVWHYTDDWTKETGTESLSGPGSNIGSVIGNNVQNDPNPEAQTVIVDVEAKTAENGKSEAKVAPEVISGAIETAKSEDVSEIVLNVTDTNDAVSVEVSLTAGSLNELIENGLNLTVQSEIASIILDTGALAIIAESAAADTYVGIVAAIVDASIELNAQQQEISGNNPVFYFTITVGTQTITNFGNGMITVSIPYTPTANMLSTDYDLLTVYHLDENSRLSEMAFAWYFAERGRMVFTTNHFSLFMISEWMSPFGDILRGDWYYRNVRYVYTNGLMTGTASDTFSPHTNLARAMIVTILWKLDNSPVASDASAFTDVASGRYYSDAIAWASTNSIVGGYGNGLFGPYDDITREQLAVILNNYAQYKGLNMTGSSYVGTYSDADSVSGWADEAMKWANANGLISGRTVSTLVPRGTATRAEAATILQRFIEGLLN